MEEMICPRCGKPSYTSAPSAPSPCPYCGFIFCNDTREPAEDQLKKSRGDEE